MAAGKNVTRQPQEVNTATLSAIRPGAPVVQLSPQEDAALSEIARNQGVNNAEAMRRIVENIPTGPQKQTVTDQSMNLLGKARELGLANDDKGDPINQVMRYGFYKDLKKDMKRGDDDRMSMREMMEMVILQRMLPPDNGAQGGNTQNQQIVNQLVAENAKLRQDFKDELEKNRQEMRDLVLEKRLQTMDDTQVETVANLSNQLADISNRMELYRTVPTNPSPEQKKDAISHLEDLGGQMERIKKALAPFGISPPSSTSLIPGMVAQDPYKRPDGSMDYFRYSVDKLESTIGKVSEAWQKKTPDRKQVVETPAPAETRQTEATYRQLTPEEYADNILSKPNPTQEEQQWLNNYSSYLEKQRGKLQTRTGVQQVESPVAAGCISCGNPEIYRDGLCQSCYNQTGTPQPEQPKKGMLERLKEQEDEELRRAQGM